MRAFFFGLLALVACGAPQSEAPTQEPRESIELRDAWAAPTPGGVDVSAGYVTIVNVSNAADRLVAASSPRAARVEVHEMSADGGVMRMRRVEGGLAIAPGATVRLEPGGLHLMFYGVTTPFAEGETIPARLAFEQAGEIVVNLPVRRPTQGHAEH